jgi:anti-sigma B factor antagonist
MEIRQRVVGDVAVIDVVGRMVLGERANDTLFRNAVADQLSAGRGQLVVNLSQVTQVDTSGLTALVTAHLTAAKRGGALKLADPIKRIRELLDITRLNTLFVVFDTEDEAIASFRGSSQSA